MSMFDAPDTPDPNAALQAGKKTAAEQQKYNVAAQAGSMVNQFNPYGSLTYQQTGTGPNGVPIYTSKVQLTPEQQELFNTYQALQQKAGASASDLLSGANYGGQDPSAAIGNIQSGMMGDLINQQKAYFDPFFQTARDQLDTKLRNQGLLPGQPGYDNAMRQMDTNQGLTISNYIAQTAPKTFEQAMQTYLLPWQLAQQQGQFGSPGNVTSQLVNAPQLQPANLIGATANAQDMLMKQYAADLQQQQGAMSGLFGIPTAVLGGWASSPAGGAAITSALGGFSDRRIKEDITQLGRLANGLNVYLFKYIFAPAYYIGLMADEVKQLHPDAVHNYLGIDWVDYSKAVRV